jgi:8-oxo-dGTP pyrophosphatase MutT (NUDIX family)
MRWQLPKGHIESAEASQEAAAREIAEETGCHGRIVADLGFCEFHYSRRSIDGQLKMIKKRVDFFLLVYESGSVYDHDTEVEEARFVSIREAERLLAFDSEKEAVRKAQEYLETSSGLFP